MLGIREVLIHPFAGRLSAFGMGLADIRALREGQISAPLREAEAGRVVLDRIAKAARAEVAAQGIAPPDIRVEATAHSVNVRE